MATKNTKAVTEADLQKKAMAEHFDKKYLSSARLVKSVIRNQDTVVTYTVRLEDETTQTRQDLASQMPDEWLSKLKV